MWLWVWILRGRGKSFVVGGKAGEAAADRQPARGRVGAVAQASGGSRGHRTLLSNEPIHWRGATCRMSSLCMALIKVAVARGRMQWGFVVMGGIGWWR